MVAKVRRNGRAWSEEEKQVLIRYYNARGVDYVSELLPHRTVGAIQRVVCRLRGEGRMGKKLIKKATRAGRPQGEPPREVIEMQLKRAMRIERRNRDYGVGGKKLDIDLRPGKKYRVKRNDIDNRLSDDIRYFTGTLIQKTDNHLTLKSKCNVRECFLKVDALIGQIEIEEVKE